MKLVSALMLVSAVAALGSTEEQIQKQFAVQPGGTVIVDVGFGSILVNTSADPAVTVDAWRRITRNRKADEAAFLRDNPLEFSQTGDTVTIRCRTKPQPHSSWSWFRRDKDEAKYSVTVPAKFNTQLRTAGGEISVQDLTGNTRAHTSGGRLHFERMHGELEANTSGGPIQVAAVEGDLKIHTSGGGIEVMRGAGSLEAGTSGGPITVKDFVGPTRVNTSGGGLSLHNLTGTLSGSTSGGSIHAVLASPLGEKTKLSTSGGSITLSIPEKAAFELDAATSGGSVSTDFELSSSGKPRRSHLKGAVNGGGNQVVLRTSGGSIRVNKS